MNVEIPLGAMPSVSSPSQKCSDRHFAGATACATFADQQVANVGGADFSLPALLPRAVSGGTSDGGTETQKGAKAAQDFEAILIGQMLRSVREEDSGWLGTDNGDAGATALAIGEEELAKAMAAGGGFGLAKIIASGLAASTVSSKADKA